MFYGPLDVNIVELTIAFCCEIICLCGCLPNAYDVFPSLLGLSLFFFFFFFFTPCLRDSVKCLPSSVTYIRRGRILSLDLLI